MGVSSRRCSTTPTTPSPTCLISQIWRSATMDLEGSTSDLPVPRPCFKRPILLRTPEPCHRLDRRIDEVHMEPWLAPSKRPIEALKALYEFGSCPVLSRRPPTPSQPHAPVFTRAACHTSATSTMARPRARHSMEV